MGEYELWVRFLCNYKLWVNTNYGGDTQTHRHTNRHTYQYYDSAGLRAGPSEKHYQKGTQLKKKGRHGTDPWPTPYCLDIYLWDMFVLVCSVRGESATFQQGGHMTMA